MAEEIPIEALTHDDFFSRAVLTLMSAEGPLERFKIDTNRKVIEVELRINGIGVPLRPLIERLENEFGRLVDEESGQKVLETFRGRQAKIEELLYKTELALKDELREHGLLRDDEG
jgi:hypothetical protein